MITNAALPAASSMASTIVSSLTSSVTERLAGRPGSCDQSTTFSIRIGVDHGDGSAALGQDRRQDGGGGCLPAPPLGELNAITGMEFPHLTAAEGDAETFNGKLTGNRKLPDGRRLSAAP